MKRQQRINCFLIVCILVASVLLSYSSKIYLNAKETEQEEKTKIHFIAYADFHGRVEETDQNPGMGKFISAVQEYCKSETKGEKYYVFSSGDNFQGTPISIATNGKIVTDMMKYMKVSYSAVGNHEFDWGEQLFTKWTEDSGTTFLSANIVNKKDGETVEGIKPYDIIESNGKKVGVIGVTTKETLYKTLKTNLEKYYFLDPKEVVIYYSKILREKEGVDAVIVLAHLGGKQDKTGKITGEIADIANSGADIDAIIGGHMHTTIQGKVNGIPIIEPASNGRALGVVTLEFTRENVKVSIKIDRISMRKETIEENEDAKKIREYYIQKYDDMLNEEVIDLKKSYKHDRESIQTDMGVFICKLMAQSANAEIAFMNSSGIRRGLDKGMVRTKDIFLIFPHNVTLCTVDLKGEVIKKIIEYGISNQKEKSGINYYGISYKRKKEHGRKTILYSIKLLNGESIDPDKTYRVVTTSYLVAGGDGYFCFRNTSTKDTRVNLRNIIIDELKKIQLDS